MLAQSKSFFSPAMDFLLIGGLSLFVYSLVVVSGVELVDFDVVWGMWLLAFFVNGPHFLISYEIFYAGHAAKLFKELRFFWAGVVVPAVLFVCLAYALVSESVSVLRFLLYLMFFSVGWHYVKQAYGCFVVYSAGQGVYFQKWEQLFIKYSLFPLWWSSFMRIFSGGDGDYWGLKYSPPQMFESLVDVISGMSVVGVIPLLGVFLVRALRGERQPSLTALVPLIVIFVWLSPLLRNDVFIYIIPFFHSLQYLLFSGVYTQGKVSESGAGKKGYLWWWGCAFVLAALAFHFVPTSLDELRLFSSSSLSNAFLVSFILFINIHHYFIDNALWRGDNQEVRQFLRMRDSSERGAGTLAKAD